jgi:hypothetical protein
VINGVAGAFIVEGPLDAEPAVAATRERVMVINELPLTHETTAALAGRHAVRRAQPLDEQLPRGHRGEPDGRERQA